VAGAGGAEDFYQLAGALARKVPVTFMAFDLLWHDGDLLLNVAQRERPDRLVALARPALGAPVMPSFDFEDAPALFRACEGAGGGGGRPQRRGGSLPAGRPDGGLAEGEGDRLATAPRAPVARRFG
jgi:hypothetical protein